MAVSLQIKRGDNKPGDNVLKAGELAFDKKNQILYIGRATSGNTVQAIEIGGAKISTLEVNVANLQDAYNNWTVPNINDLYKIVEGYSTNNHIKTAIDANKIDITTLKKDYILDEGYDSSVKLYWRKWNNGVAECWGRTNIFCDDNGDIRPKEVRFEADDADGYAMTGLRVNKGTDVRIKYPQDLFMAAETTENTAAWAKTPSCHVEFLAYQSDGQGGIEAQGNALFSGIYGLGDHRFSPPFRILSAIFTDSTLQLMAQVYVVGRWKA